MKAVQHVKEHEGVTISYRDAHGRRRAVLARSTGRGIRLVLLGDKPRTLRLSRETAAACMEALGQLLAIPAPSDNRS